jgi:predicted TIM-barrel fold metal-dependent hydrolase
MQQYRVIDADSHFSEPLDMWPQYLPAHQRDFAPRRVEDTQGLMHRLLDGKVLPYIPPPPRSQDAPPIAGGWDPHARLATMDAEGIDVMVMYPSAGLHFAGIEHLEVVQALSRAYNRWAADYCSAAPTRLFAPVLVPQMDIAAAMDEARFGVEQLGLRGVFLRPNPVAGRTLDHPAFEPLWSLIEDLDVPLVLHEGTTQNVTQVGLDRYDNFLFRHVCSHPFEQQMAMLSLICGRVLERHPRLRVATVEAGCGWVPYWLERLDEHMEEWGHASAPLKEQPSTYFKQQWVVSMDPEETTMAAVVRCIGNDNLVFSTDYPHPDHQFDGIVSSVANREDLSEESKAKILGRNAARTFKV